MSVDLDYCAGCSNVFSGRSKPRWAFGQDGRLLGRTHTSCLWYRDSERMLTIYGTLDLDEAHFSLWQMEFLERPDEGTVEWDAWLLLDRPSEMLSDRVCEILQHNLQSGKWTIGRILNVWMAHAVFVREFHAWRAELPA